MPFGPFNALAFYSCMMGNFKVEWDSLFLESMSLMYSSNTKLDGKKISVIDNVVFVDNVKLHSGTKSIIDDILIWSNNLPDIFIYFECVCKVFQKHRVSFRLDKCRFLQERIEFVGHDHIPDGNCPEASKSDMINN